MDDVKIEHCAKRVRVYLGGKIIVDSIRSKLVWEVPNYPTYYFPMADVSTDCLLESDHSDRSSTRGLARYFWTHFSQSAPADPLAAAVTEELTEV